VGGGHAGTGGGHAAPGSVPPEPGAWAAPGAVGAVGPLRGTPLPPPPGSGPSLASTGAHFGERIEELVTLVRRLEQRLASAGGAGIARFDVALGASSPSNFYRSLEGNDVVMHGGLFVATYAKLPPIGASVLLGIELPGGNRFEVVGTIAWTQDELGEDSPSGFGARLPNAPEDARAMIAQFVRHRAPLMRE
jgi:hypothetical protein